MYYESIRDITNSYSNLISRTLWILSSPLHAMTITLSRASAGARPSELEGGVNIPSFSKLVSIIRICSFFVRKASIIWADEYLVILLSRNYCPKIVPFQRFQTIKLFFHLSSTHIYTQLLQLLNPAKMSTTGHIISAQGGYTNYVAYRDPKALGQGRIGHLDLQKSTIQPLCFESGTPLSNLYEVIETGESHIKPAGEVVAFHSVELLAPISGKDILAVGKNYSEHAKEFNSSGYDSSDKVDQPTHPVIFTKRSTSIIASGEPIFPHPGFTESVDYEGEIGVIIGKSGFRIKEEDAMKHVWG